MAIVKYVQKLIIFCFYSQKGITYKYKKCFVFIKNERLVILEKVFFQKYLIKPQNKNYVYNDKP